MIAAIRAEALKLAHSLVGRVATAAIVLGVTALSVTMVLALRAGDPRVLTKLGDITADWSGFIAAAVQITGAGGLLASAVVLGWMVGREFSDRAVHGLFALPVGRASILGAKLIVYAAWSLAVAVLLPLILLGTGVAMGLGVPDADAVGALGRLAMLSATGALLATPVALAATLGRSVLAAVGVALGLVVIAQVSVLVEVGGWMPLAAPALWALSAGAEVSPLQLSLVIPFAGVWIVGALVGWHRLELDR
jgi:ABC-2 type transport system permease protein